MIFMVWEKYAFVHAFGAMYSRQLILDSTEEDFELHQIPQDLVSKE